MTRIALSGLFCWLWLSLGAQTDTTLLRLDRLGEADLRPAIQRSDASARLFSFDRSAQDVRDMPRTVYVITREEIIANGYVTLADALKMIPGIRVSQPGSALLGETFLMRGHLGNHYAKILINDVPIRSIFAPGQSIGTQLPIRQAERIEITFGSTTTLYGGDASVGVINIILNESERPTFTQSALTFNALEGFSGINVQFGGKLGSGNKVFKFNVYGGNTLQTSRNVINNYPELYRYDRYTRPGSLDSIYPQLDNFRAVGSDSSSLQLPLIDDLPHQSRYLGAMLTFRRHQLSVFYSYRRDHTAVGLNPLAVSYADPSTYIGENHFDLSYRHTGKQRRGRLTVGFLLNQLGTLSSTRFLYPTLQRNLDTAISRLLDPDPADPQSVSDFRFFRLAQRSQYFSDLRYQFSGSARLRTEYFYEIVQTDRLEWILGLQGKLTLGVPYNPYLVFPVDEDFTPYRAILVIEQLGDLLFEETARAQLVIPTQLNVKFDRLALQLGGQYVLGDSEQSILNGQFAALYRLDDNWRVRATGGSATRQPSPYYQQLARIDPSMAQRAITQLFEQSNPERTVTAELGLRYDRPLFQADLSAFYQRTGGIPVFLEQATDPFDPNVLITGYYRRDRSFQRMLGMQGQVRWQNLVRRVDLVVGGQVSRSRVGVAAYPTGDVVTTTDRIAGQPNTLLQARLSYRFWQRYHLQADNVYGSAFFTYRLGEQRQPAYYTLNLIGRIDFSRNFQLQLAFKNVFDQAYGGIDATGTADDLLYNPQVGRIVQFGASYRLD